MTFRIARIGTATGLAFAAGASAFMLAGQPAQPARAAQPAQAAQAAQGTQAGQAAQGTQAGQAADPTGTAQNCRGRRIERRIARYRGRPVAELVVYRSGSRYCARTNHLGETRGRNLRTSVFLAACRERRPSRTCHYFGRPASEDGRFRFYAGPVHKDARNRCIHAAGDIYYHGRRHLETRPAASHCR